MWKAFKSRLLLVGSLLALIWAVSWLVFLFEPKVVLGIIPRTEQGLLGILTAPFVHANLTHLAANTMGILTFAWYVAWRGPNYFIASTLLIILLGGLGVWVFARANIHIGASGLVFGYFGQLIARSMVEKSVQSILLSNLLIFLYGGMIWGIFPSIPRVSWESHLFGFFAGILVAILFGKFNPPRITKSKK